MSEEAEFEASVAKTKEELEAALDYFYEEEENCRLQIRYLEDKLEKLSE